jgi:hypothetical protein
MGEIPKYLAYPLTIAATILGVGIAQIAWCGGWCYEGFQKVKWKHKISNFI